jgi:exosome complex RNA-binding protein Rrp42 (RNase PH superfamily)
MTQTTRFYGENRQALIENIANGFYVLSLYENGERVDKRTMNRLREAEILADNFVKGIDDENSRRINSRYNR